MTCLKLGENIPALMGGSPVRDKFLPFSQPRLSEKEIGAVNDTLRSGWLTTASRTHEFEEAFKSYVGTEHAVALNSCTAGLFLSLKILGIGPGDEVITTPLTFAATVNVIEHTGASTVFADIDPVTWNIDTRQIEKKATGATRAIIPVHLYGRPCGMNEISRIAHERNIMVIQDCAHAIECEIDGKNVAQYGDIACYSFYATKNVTTGEGGMVATDNSEWAEEIRVLALHGLDKSAYSRYSDSGKATYDLRVPGYKYNMPDITAALGVEGLKLIEQRQARRVSIWNRYISELSGLPGLTLPAPPEVNTRHARHLFVCALDPEKSGIDRDQMVEALKAENIGTGIHYRPVHQYTYYRDKYGDIDSELPNASTIGARVFSLPLTPFLNDDDVSDVIRAVCRIIEHYRKGA